MKGLSLDILGETNIGACVQRIISDFGDGQVRTDKYIFEQITHLPPGGSCCRLKAGDAIGYIGDAGAIVVLDPHPNNRRFAIEVAEHLGSPDDLCFHLSRQQVERVLRFDQCDMYVIGVERDVLIVGCHEDRSIEDEREVWVAERATKQSDAPQVRPAAPPA